MRKRKLERIPVFEVSGERERVLLGQILVTDNDTTDSIKVCCVDCRLCRCF
jgi:hypothetical protein